MPHPNAVQIIPLSCDALVRSCAGFRPPATRTNHALRGPAAEKRQRHEIASGGSGRAEPQGNGAAKKAMEIWARGRTSDAT